MALRTKRVETGEAGALRALAYRVEKTGKRLPRPLVSAVVEALEDAEDLEAVRDWRERKAAGEKSVPAAVVWAKLGL